MKKNWDLEGLVLNYVVNIVENQDISITRNIEINQEKGIKKYKWSQHQTQCFLNLFVEGNNYIIKQKLYTYALHYHLFIQIQVTYHASHRMWVWLKIDTPLFIKFIRGYTSII